MQCFYSPAGEVLEISNVFEKRGFFYSRRTLCFGYQSIFEIFEVISPAGEV